MDFVVSAGNVIEELETRRVAAESLRDLAKDFQQSYELLAPIVDRAEKLLRTISDDVGPLHDDERKRLSELLSQCYGALGGLLRRQGNLEASLACYRQGALVEIDELDGGATYSTVQAVVVEALAKGSLSEVQAKAVSAMQRLVGDINAGRRSDYWAYADLGILALLADSPSLASASFEMFETSPGGLARTAEVLAELEPLLAETARPAAARARQQIERQHVARQNSPGI